MLMMQEQQIGLQDVGPAQRATISAERNRTWYISYKQQEVRARPLLRERPHGTRGAQVRKRVAGFYVHSETERERLRWVQAMCGSPYRDTERGW
jgi:hypothetical protein